jgi:hypothetical protein
MRKTIQTTLFGGKLAFNGKTFRTEEIFIAYLLLAQGKTGDTFKDILKRVTVYAPMIRYKNEAMIKNVLRKMERTGVIRMGNTILGKVITGKSIEAEQESLEFHKKVLWLEKIFESPNF